MLDFTEESLKKVLTRYNVALEKEMTPEEAAEELYPKDELIYPIAKAIFEGEEDDVVEGLQAENPLPFGAEAAVSVAGCGDETSLDSGERCLDSVHRQTDIFIRVEGRKTNISFTAFSKPGSRRADNSCFIEKQVEEVP